MAGKHIGADHTGAATTAVPSVPGANHLFIHHYHPKEDKAYAEGRLGLTNQHLVGSRAWQAHENGTNFAILADRQLETAVP